MGKVMGEWLASQQQIFDTVRPDLLVHLSDLWVPLTHLTLMSDDALLNSAALESDVLRTIANEENPLDAVLNQIILSETRTNDGIADHEYLVILIKLLNDRVIHLAEEAKRVALEGESHQAYCGISEESLKQAGVICETDAIESRTYIEEECFLTALSKQLIATVALNCQTARLALDWYLDSKDLSASRLANDFDDLAELKISIVAGNHILEADFPTAVKTLEDIVSRGDKLETLEKLFELHSKAAISLANRKAGKARGKLNESLRSRVIDIYQANAAKWSNAADAAKGIIQTIDRDALANLSEENAEKTMARWIRDYKKTLR